MSGLRRTAKVDRISRERQLPKKKLPISFIERDLKVIEAISQTLYVLELLNSTAVEAQGTKYRLDFTAEIDRLRFALRIMRADDEQRSDL
jgi:hypothetical protein